MNNDLGQDIINGVDKYGLFIVNSFPSDDGSDGDQISSYTIGLGNLPGWSELICFGRVADEAQQMLWLAVQECSESSTPPSDGLELVKVLNGRSVKLVRNDEVLKAYCGLADWYARQTGRAEPKRLQLMWPDENGLFPDDEGCSPAVRDAQIPRLTA